MHENSESPDARLQASIAKLDADAMAEAIACGTDVNFACDADGGALREVFFHAYFFLFDGERDVPSAEKFEEYERRVFRCVKILLDNGYDLNRVYVDGNERSSVFCDVARWCASLKIMEHLLQRGMNPNLPSSEGVSALDSLEGEIWSEEACGRPRDAKFIYGNARLAVAYGALPAYLLNDTRTARERTLHAAAMNLDCDKISELDAAAISEFRLDAACVTDSKYAFPRDFYFETPKLEARIIAALRVIIEKLGGVGKLDDSLLHGCVELQYVDVLSFLLRAGVNPNLNCFNEAYPFVASSAFYKFLRHQRYYLPERAKRMRALLSEAGAIRLAKDAK